MKKPVRYLFAGILTLLGFSSCTALREARQAEIDRQKAEIDRLQEPVVDDVRARLEAEGQAGDNAEWQREQRIRDSLRRAERERAKLLYAVPNVPYREIKEQ